MTHHSLVSVHITVQSCCLVGAWRPHSGKRSAFLAENAKTYWTRDFSLALCPQQEGYVGSGIEGWVDGVVPLVVFHSDPLGSFVLFIPRNLGLSEVSY